MSEPLLLDTSGWLFALEGQEPFAGARELDRKFRSADLGLVDCTIAALAERTGMRRVLTADADFSIVRIGPHYRQSLEIVGGSV